MGNSYLRRLLVVGATSVTRRAATINTQTGAWVRSLLERMLREDQANGISFASDADDDDGDRTAENPI